MDNTNRGAIWKNKKKDRDSHPDFTGSLNVDGVEYWLNGWLRPEDASASAPSMKFTVRLKDAPKQPSSGRAAPKHYPDDRITTGRREFDDEVPF